MSVLAAVMLAVPAGASVANRGGERPGAELWQQVPGKPAKTRGKAKAQVKTERFRPVSLNRGGMRAALARAPREHTPAARQRPLVLSLPTPEAGEFQRFALQESPIMEPALAAKHPQIKTYSGRGIDDPTATIRADLTPLGFHASVRSHEGTWYIDPYYNGDDSVYASYYTRDLQIPEEFLQREPVDDHGHEHDDDDDHGARDGEAGEAGSASAGILSGPEVVLRTYRIAMVSETTYASYFGAENVTAAKVTLLNRVNQIYEDDSAIRMILVADTDKTNLNAAADVTGANGPCGGAPCYTSTPTSCSSALLTRTRIVLGQLIGASNFDVGHIVMGRPGGGIASLGVVGGNAKAQGCTGLPNPVGDFFAVDYVAHELGHQFNANHTFNGTVGNCSGGNRSAANSVEPGSGSSVMAYAGICGTDNLQPHTDAYWSARSMVEISNLVTQPRPAINEVQTVSLRNWNTNGQSFRLSYQGSLSAPIVRGTNYTTAAIASAITGLTGGTVTVAGWAAGTFNDFGFQVTWSGANAQTNLAQLGVVEFTGGASGFVGETAKGGPVDNQGWQVTPTGNQAPVVSTPMQFTIPVRTPFALTGSATDADGDELTYLWEQIDRGGTTGTSLTNNNKVNGPLFRQFGTALLMPPYDPLQYNSPGSNIVGTDPTRVFPDLGQILANNTNAVTGACPTPVAPLPRSVIDCYSEFLPTAAYLGFAGVNASPARLNFRLTVRDHSPGGGGVGSNDTTLVLAHGAGPFLVTSHDAGGAVAGGSEQVVTWNVASTNVAPVNVANVKISLSTDGGWTYPHVLAESTPNNGSATVTLPNLSVDEARIKVEAVGNVFFDLNDASFAIKAVPVVTNDAPAGGAVVQYSDALSPTVTISASDADSPGSALTASATGLPDGLSLAVASTSAGATLPGTRTWTVAGNVTAAPGSYPVTVTVTDETGGSGSTSFTIVVTQEDADVTYTGDGLAFTASGGSSANVLLRATVRDSAVIPGSGDTAPGDVRNATVVFKKGAATLCGPLAVQLIDGATTVGTASCTVSLGLGDHEIDMVVNGYYTGTGDTLVQVSQPDGSFITGGGQIDVETSAGSHPATAGSALKFAFNVRFLPNGRTIQGSANIRFVSGGRTYQLKTTALDSLGITRRDANGAVCAGPPSPTCFGLGDFRSRANLQDVTDPANPVSVASGLSLRLTVTDKGTPGSSDSIGVTAWQGSTLVLSSQWTGAATTERTLTGGNLAVH